MRATGGEGWPSQSDLKKSRERRKKKKGRWRTSPIISHNSDGKSAGSGSSTGARKEIGENTCGIPAMKVEGRRRREGKR